MERMTASVRAVSRGRGGGGEGKKAEKLGEVLSYGDTTQLSVITHDRL